MIKANELENSTQVRWLLDRRGAGGCCGPGLRLAAAGWHANLPA
jgi:hypothetical protein